MYGNAWKRAERGFNRGHQGNARPRGSAAEGLHSTDFSMQLVIEFKDHRRFSMPWPDRNKIDMEDASRSPNARQTSPAFSRSAATSRSAISARLCLGKYLDMAGLPRKIASMFDNGLVVAGLPDCPTGEPRNTLPSLAKADTRSTG